MMLKKWILFFKLIPLSSGKLSSQNTKFFANSESEIRFFGWALLGLWIVTIIYMTRDFFFPSIFSHEIRSPTVSNIDFQRGLLKTVDKEKDNNIASASNTIVRYRFSGNPC